MRIETSDVIVVEGQSDVALLEQIIDAIYVITNGSEVSRETLDYIKELSKSHRIIVFTDPDSPGKRIRDLVEQTVGNVTHAFLNKRDAIKKNKVGVAEANKDAIIKALSHLLESKKVANTSPLLMSDLYELSLIGQPNSHQLRATVSEHFHLGFNNGKTLLKRLNTLQISKQELDTFLKEHIHENRR